MFINLNKAGDTIVEVLIGLAVLGSVLTAGYSISTRSLNGIRVSQERGEALKIAEEQLEKIRYNLARPDVTVNDFLPIAPNNYTCYKTLNPTSIQLADIKDLNSYSECKFINLYHVAIETKTVSTGTFDELTFNVNVHWDRIGGGQMQELTLVYKAVL